MRWECEGDMRWGVSMGGRRVRVGGGRVRVGGGE